MTLKTRPVRLSLLSLLSAPLAGAKINAQLSLSVLGSVVLPAYEIDGTDVVTLVVPLTEDPAKPGDYVGQLWPNTRGLKGTRWLINVAAGELLMKSLNLTVIDGDSALEVPLEVIVNAPPYAQVFPSSQVVGAAQSYADAAGYFASLAMEAAGQNEEAPPTILRDIVYSDPYSQYFGSSGTVIEQVPGQISGDPFTIWDGTQYVMYFFRAAPAATCHYKTAPSLEGPWSASTQIASLNTYHKFALLVDDQGAPVQVGGAYHGYAVYFDGATLASKEIYHFTGASLTGAWTLGGKVIAKGAAGSKDEYNTDTPCAVFADGVVSLWYMGSPASALTTYGLAERMLRATAAAPAGPFTKDYADVLLPAATAAWDYGWMGGVQVRLRPSGGYVMVYNAGSTRPDTPGDEPAASAIGMAYADDLAGPWTKDAANPYIEITGTPSDALEKLNVWRGHLAWDRAIKRWYLFYNVGSGTETITFARQGVYDYFYASQGNPYEVQALTTSKVALANSRVNLVPGVYRVHAAINVIGDGGSESTPKLDVDTSFRIDGTDYKLAGRDFIGSYAYENRDLIVDHIFAIRARGYVDLAIQVTGGVPVAQSKARRLRINITQIGSAD